MSGSHPKAPGFAGGYLLGGLAAFSWIYILRYLDTCYEAPMAYNIKDPQTDRIIRELAKIKRKPILDAIREACEHEIERERRKTPLWDRLQPLLDQIASAPKTGLNADKRFFDELSGERE
jgi:antitoxin VapB